jgi:HK97 family phage major capsid protein
MPSTTRERLETAVKGLQSFSDEVDKKDAPSVEDYTSLTQRAEEVMRLKASFEQESTAAGTLTDAKAFLAKLAEPADGQIAELAAGQAAKTLAAQTLGGLPMDTRGKTFGELFVQSEQYQDFRKRYGGRDGVIPDSVKGIQSPTYFAEGVNAKALITGLSDTSAGAFVRNDIYAPVTDLIGERELTITDLITRGSTDSDTIEYVRITGKTNNAAPVPEATSSGQPALYNAPTGPELAAGGYKPESGLALEKVTTTVKTLAHWMPMTKRAASDAGQVRTLVDNFLRYGLAEKLEDQILTGAGTGENFQGINNAGILTVGSAGTDIDAVVDAIRTVRVTGRRRPSAIVMHPNDWYSTGFLLAKDTQGRYLIGDPRASLEQLNSLWGMRVVISEAQTENTALVGDFRFGVLWEREGVSISVSDSHLDFFTRNLLAILAEMRAGFGVLDAQAFCTVTAV